MTTYDPHYPDGLGELGFAVLDAGHVPGPPAPPFKIGTGYPLALCVNGDLAAVSFAVLDAYPDIAMGWWCFLESYQRTNGLWGYTAAPHDNTTSETPFARPTGGIEWVSFGGVSGWDDEPKQRHSYFGIAGTDIARLAIGTCEVPITPWCGAWVVIAPGDASTLTAYDAAGVVVDEIAYD
ncbi:hypothetical protein C8N24_3890 [Solirubrobacter pauli]|uniref:Uncharacterized protein n=1 Tax=Solirubrobacter pauli TaxID=166793 RepID=A0A660LKF2_9ACTN|nr:hypothetical protein [Solirubrobacter pauli]RKQ94014.1 hypothetical protein C8N24_3890 [Solirubrobacter pauli]